ncbi:dipeptide ABC transporter ATP-binding protein [Serinibacter salmoneus]|uniref:Peptide/nickel transport system ATP-binding protein n=1 Tax=Serinibacter salmoneus TaxID=556530 RepID=A0A2A9D195_9MICO|nr:ABC transporter ATP-binding protein [Serinibacter salmoneus]PFG20161.1 peptide/nickel transport system ATP-binding protein [Serinibacter salmoneus]
MTAPALDLRDLSVGYDTPEGVHQVTHAVSVSVAPGELVALVGESGSGKSTTAQAALNLLPTTGRVLSGRIAVAGEDLTDASAATWRCARGRRIALVPQDPGASLDPTTRIGDSIAAAFRIHRAAPRRVLAERVVDLLERVGIDDPRRRARQYPHELSGGMRQRVLIAGAIALDPSVIVADEPTSALDVTVQRRVLDLLDELRRSTGTGILLVTHDLALAADHADRVVVLREGRVQESGPADAVLRDPSAPYTRRLLADAPTLATPITRKPRVAEAGSALRVRDLTVTFGRRRHAFTAVDGVSFDIPQGTTHAIVGESGSGKTTTARAVAAFQSITSGSVQLLGREVASLGSAGRRELRRSVQLVYQNPDRSLDPRHTVLQAVTEPLRNFSLGTPAEQRRRAAEVLERVALDPALHARRPRELSGGQRQRAAIARALVLDPDLLILDEATSALDVTVQAGILRLLADLQNDLDTTYLVISHDLAVVRQIADTITVLRGGHAVEAGSVREIFETPREDYTRDLIAAIPGAALPSATVTASVPASVPARSNA